MDEYLQWIEDRFWVRMHYIAAKIARGELFEAIDGLVFVRSRVLGPLILSEAGAWNRARRTVCLRCDRPSPRTTANRAGPR
ncbi:MAG: hypothetical protein HYU41_23240 [Candidatus Rokubacteria bacterium]|nr:hypothetical protein [Candidatus Rokubacteria bacterium]